MKLYALLARAYPSGLPRIYINIKELFVLCNAKINNFFCIENIDINIGDA